jgi:hypothetical protein
MLYRSVVEGILWRVKSLVLRMILGAVANEVAELCVRIRERVDLYALMWLRVLRGERSWEL